MNRRDGQFYYAPHRRLWGVWQWHESGSYGEFVRDFETRDAAVLEVYRRNGWRL